MTINKSKQIIGLIGILIYILNIGFVFSNSCFQEINDISIIENITSSNPNEYILRINQNVIEDKNLVFTLVNQLPESCLDKNFILEIDQTRTFKLTDTNKYLEISGDINLIRFKSTDPNGSYINFIVDNDEEDPLMYNNSGPGILNIKIPIEVTSKGGIIAFEEERSSINTGNDEDSNKRSGYGAKIILKDILIKSQIDFNISVVATNPQDYPNCVENTTQHGIHGGVSELSIDTLENYGTFNILLKGADGSKGSNGCNKENKSGGVGGNGGIARINIDSIENYSDLNITVISGNGANGAQGSNEGKGPKCRGHPKSGGKGGDGANLNYSIKNIFNNENANFNINLNSGNGGNGGRAGNDWCKKNGREKGGAGGVAGNINLIEKTYIENKGQLNILGIGGSGGEGNTGSKYHKTYRGETGRSGNGGSISDYNFSKIINIGDFKLNLKSGNININSIINSVGDNGNPNQNRGTAVAGSIGSINIDNLVNKSINFEIIMNLNENNINNLNSSSCDCSIPGSNCVITGEDPKIGNIVIDYLSSGSFLPKTLEIQKNKVLTSMPEIIINSCYLMSIGNSQINYVADTLTLKGTNLETVINDFSEDSKVSQYLLIPNYCPVCDGLDLDSSLRIDKEYTIYSPIDYTITDLNIYYLDSNGNRFKPPGYPEEQDFVVYSLKADTNIISSESLIFGEDIKEYKITKEKLHYNPMDLDLEQLNNTIPLNNIKLFCPGQRYELVYKFGNITKTIPFTPLFNIR